MGSFELPTIIISKMPNWKKLIVSGSDAALSNLNVTNDVTASAFVGDGSALTGIDTGGFGYSNPISMSADTSTTAGNYTSIYGPMQINSGVTFTVTATSLVKVETF